MAQKTTKTLGKTAAAPTFTFDYPEAWADASTITVLAPPEPGCTPNLSITQELMAANDEPDDWIARQEFSSQQLPGYTGIDRGERMLGSTKSQYWSFLWTAPSGERIWQMQACAVSPDQHRMGVTVTCTSLARDRQHFRDLFNRMLSTFTWRQP